MKHRLYILVALMLLALAGCGKVTNEREPDLVVRGDATADAANEAPDRVTRGVRIATARLVFITHGQASDEFWKVVQRGKDDAHKQTGAAVSYRSPDSFSIDRMRRYIDEAVADHPDGLIVSLPDAKALAPSIKAAVKAGIPVITINSGSDEFRKLGVLAHVGQDEYKAGLEAGRRMGRAGVKRALCVNQENGNTGLDQRCRGLGDGLAKTGGTSKPLPVPLQNENVAQTRMAEALNDRPSTASSRSARAAPSRRSTRSGDRPPVAREARDLRPLARTCWPRCATARCFRGRPAALSAGLSAGDAARPAGALRRLPGRGRADPDRARSSSRGRTPPRSSGSAPRAIPLIGANRDRAREPDQVGRRELDLEPAPAA